MGCVFDVIPHFFPCRLCRGVRGGPACWRLGAAPTIAASNCGMSPLENVRSRWTHTHRYTCSRPASNSNCFMVKGTIRRARVILNHRPVKSRFNSRSCGSERSDWSLRRPRPLSVHSSSRDCEHCRLTYARSAPKNA